MGFLDRLKKMLGGEESQTETEEPQADPRAKRRRNKGERPPLSAPVDKGATLDDALAARASGDKKGAREILQTIDRGAGLRTVLRAAAALEAGDDAEVRELAPKVHGGDAPWRLDLQIAAALGDERGARFLDRARREGAPPWAIGWAGCAIGDDDARRAALVDLLFADPPMARTVAARDLKIEGAHEEATAIARYAALDAGREAIRKFDVASVVKLLDRVDPMGR